jgi:hypothetical protein
MLGYFALCNAHAATLGKPANRMSSAIYFDRPIFQKRDTAISKDNKNGQMYHKAFLRQN